MKLRFPNINNRGGEQCASNFLSHSSSLLHCIFLTNLNHGQNTRLGRDFIFEYFLLHTSTKGNQTHMKEAKRKEFLLFPPYCFFQILNPGISQHYQTLIYPWKDSLGYRIKQEKEVNYQWTTKQQMVQEKRFICRIQYVPCQPKKTIGTTRWSFGSFSWNFYLYQAVQLLKFSGIG